MSNKQHLFGPVNSRRLGRSLGVNLIPFKTCSLDCVFCECGKTTCLTTTNQNYVHTDEVTRELKKYLADKPELDYITFSGAGEPTLAGNIGEIIDFLKDNYPQYKICVLTNSTLLPEKKVRQRLLRSDLVIPTLSAITQDVFNKINRPGKLIHPKNILEGLRDFKHEYNGKIWIETFIVPGLNDNIDELTLLKNFFLEFRPEKLQLNSLDRQGTEAWVTAASEEEMQKVVEFFKPLKVEYFTVHAGEIKNESQERF